MTETKERTPEQIEQEGDTYMDKAQIQETLKSGRNHPIALFERLIREGDKEGARLVAELGPSHLRGAERLQFRNLVKRYLPEVIEAENARATQRSQETQQQREQSTGEALKRWAAEKRVRRTGAPLPTGGSWNTPLSK